ncbi:chlorhexidine efflux transporter, partial [Halomonas sp. SIMBA_159]
MLKYAGHVHKSTKQRIVHALGFEICLLWLTLPIMAWWLEIGLWQALLMDIGLVIFYLIYAYVYNLT